MSVEYVEEPYEVEDSPCHPYGQTQEGYGSKIATPYKVSFPLGGKRKYRVYATCYSNVASHWIMIEGRKQHISL